MKRHLITAAVIALAALTPATVDAAPPPATVRGCTLDTGERRIQIVGHDVTPNPIVGVGLDGRFWNYWVQGTGVVYELTTVTPGPWVAAFVQTDTDRHAWDFTLRNWWRNGGRWVWMGTPCDRVWWA